MWLYLRSVKKFVMIAAALGVVVLATAPAWTNYTDTLEDKMAANEKTGGFLTARQALWEQRWKEFKKEPGFGVGFSKVERTTEDEDTSKFKIGSGMVEPGNGWLFVLSSTGIGGFALLLWIYLKTLCKLSVCAASRRGLRSACSSTSACTASPRDISSRPATSSASSSGSASASGGPCPVRRTNSRLGYEEARIRHRLSH